MSEVLSQNEIDNLLKALNSGELDVDVMKDTNDTSVKNYDFKRPAKFSKEHLRTLELIFDHYGRLLSTNLPVYLRKNVQVNVAYSETVTFSEFSNSLGNPSVLSIIKFNPLAGDIIINLTSNLGFAMVDRMLGGQGKTFDKNRDFSEIEIRILEKLLVICMQLLREPWKNVIEINPVLDRIETNPQFAQIIAPNEMIAIVTLNIKIGDVEGFMNVALPYITIESVIDNLNTKFWFSNMTQFSEEVFNDYIEGMLKRVDVPLKCLLGKSSVTVSDFTNLSVGDIIRLDTNVESALEVYVGNIKKFTAVAGASNDKYAVKVTSVLREEE
ncbi:MAG: flagellar motor switch protein FliM [Lachnospiraceae bacterium]|nr:flagellar motor switch protein FliM [Lachnospiraceae bacterium]MBO7374193.1 flagellar motor switch protein FliM [Lachnospiraceae bacterium]MBP5276501.1 flagellar motor switch protein FliM [Lachnospiraceae bacterium]MBP5565737.1 flagellar motor switch protein FliM [Lachnospiraceae bacterium]MBQ4274920.1 flagellar motor switch protein FliM [Lachnospiraceae bacterium]